MNNPQDEIIAHDSSSSARNADRSLLRRERAHSTNSEEEHKRDLEAKFRRKDGRKFVEKGSLNEEELRHEREKTRAVVKNKREDELTREEILADRRAANRLSAFQSRMRRKTTIEELKRKVAELSKQTAQQVGQLSSLREELEAYRQENCGLRMQLQAEGITPNPHHQNLSSKKRRKTELCSGEMASCTSPSQGIENISKTDTDTSTSTNSNGNDSLAPASNNYAGKHPALEPAAGRMQHLLSSSSGNNDLTNAMALLLNSQSKENGSMLQGNVANVHGGTTTDLTSSLMLFGSQSGSSGTSHGGSIDYGVLGQILPQLLRLHGGHLNGSRNTAQASVSQKFPSQVATEQYAQDQSQQVPLGIMQQGEQLAQYLQHQPPQQHLVASVIASLQQHHQPPQVPAPAFVTSANVATAASLAPSPMPLQGFAAAPFARDDNDVLEKLHQLLLQTQTATGNHSLRTYANPSNYS